VGIRYNACQPKFSGIPKFPACGRQSHSDSWYSICQYSNELTIQFTTSLVSKYLNEFPFQIQRDSVLFDFASEPTWLTSLILEPVGIQSWSSGMICPYWRWRHNLCQSKFSCKHKSFRLFDSFKSPYSKAWIAAKMGQLLNSTLHRFPGVWGCRTASSSVIRVTSSGHANIHPIIDDRKNPGIVMLNAMNDASLPYPTDIFNFDIPFPSCFLIIFRKTDPRACKRDKPCQGPGYRWYFP